MTRQLRRYVVLSLCLLVAVAIPAWGDYCVECFGGGPLGFYCTGTGIGGQLCRASDTMCTLLGTCPALPPPPPPPPPNPKDLALIQEIFVDLPDWASLDQATAVSLSAAEDVQGITSEIATLANITPTDVAVKAGVFGVGELPIEVRGGGAVGDSVFVYRVDPLENSLRVRTCAGLNGGPPTLTSDMSVASEGAVLLVPATIKEGSAVVAYRIVITPQETFDADPLAPQDDFKVDVKSHLAPDPWEVTSGELSEKCE